LAASKAQRARALPWLRANMSVCVCVRACPNWRSPGPLGGSCRDRKLWSARSPNQQLSQLFQNSWSRGVAEARCVVPGFCREQGFNNAVPTLGTSTLETRRHRGISFAVAIPGLRSTPRCTSVRYLGVRMRHDR
jgi:hypothetical protein